MLVNGEPFVATLGQSSEYFTLSRLRDYVYILNTEKLTCSQNGAYVEVLMEVFKNQGD